MAEIKIEKKAPIWPWILGILIIAGLVYYFVSRDEEEVVEREDTTVITTNDVNTNASSNNEDAIASYASFVESADMDVEYTYTSDALHKLIAATRSAAEMSNVNIDADLTAATERADEITKNPQSLEHANMIKDAASTITKA